MKAKQTYRYIYVNNPKHKDFMFYLNYRSYNKSKLTNIRHNSFRIKAMKTLCVLNKANNL